MKIRNKWIIACAMIGIILLGVVQGIIVPRMAEAKQQYAADQLSPLTHHLDSITKYKNKYMGNASNLSNLFYSLPLGQYGDGSQLFPETLTAQINYQPDASSLDPSLLYQSLIYDATAAFALIDNLQQLQFHFQDRTYTTSRDKVKTWYEDQWSSLTEPDMWKKSVQNNLSDETYVTKGMQTMFNIQ